jgi:hypothetical protein
VNTVQWNLNTDPELLRAALEDMGMIAEVNSLFVLFRENDPKRYGYWHKFNRQTGEMLLYDSRVDPLNRDGFATGEALGKQIKQAYSRESVKAAAKRMGWTVKVDAKDKNKMQIRKRA